MEQRSRRAGAPRPTRTRVRPRRDDELTSSRRWTTAHRGATCSSPRCSAQRSAPGSACSPRARWTTSARCRAIARQRRPLAQRRVAAAARCDRRSRERASASTVADARERDRRRRRAASCAQLRARDAPAPASSGSDVGLAGAAGASRAASAALVAGARARRAAARRRRARGRRARTSSSARRCCGRCDLLPGARRRAAARVSRTTSCTGRSRPTRASRRSTRRPAATATRGHVGHGDPRRGARRADARVRARLPRAPRRGRRSRTTTSCRGSSRSRRAPRRSATATGRAGSRRTSATGVSRRARELILLDHARSDEHLDRILSPTIFSTPTNRRIFRGMVHVADSESWQRIFQLVTENSRWDLHRRRGRAVPDAVVRLHRRLAAAACDALGAVPARPVGRRAAATSRSACAARRCARGGEDARARRGGAAASGCRSHCARATRRAARAAPRLYARADALAGRALGEQLSSPACGSALPLGLLHHERRRARPAACVSPATKRCGLGRDARRAPRRPSRASAASSLDLEQPLALGDLPRGSSPVRTIMREHAASPAVWLTTPSRTRSSSAREVGRAHRAKSAIVLPGRVERARARRA